MKGVIIIPARLQSTRLPGKLLLDRTGKPLIRHVYDNCKAAVERSDGLLDGPFIATPDFEIANLFFPYEVIQTGKGKRSFWEWHEGLVDNHPNGTSRCAEALGNLSEPYDFVINVQADEPELSPEAILTLAKSMVLGMLPMATLVTEEQIESWRFNDPSTVKVVMDECFRALYFSRCPIGVGEMKTFHRHIGCYGYWKEVLARLTLPAVYEDLEQTLALFMGIPIKCVPVESDQAGYAINTASDYEQFVFRYLKEHPECHSHA